MGPLTNQRRRRFSLFLVQYCGERKALPRLLTGGGGGGGAAEIALIQAHFLHGLFPSSFHLFRVYSDSPSGMAARWEPPPRGLAWTF